MLWPATIHAMIQRDKIVIALMLCLAVAAATYAWWFRFDQGNQAARFWGGRSANLIRNAPQVELLLLQADSDGGDADAGERIQMRDESIYVVVDRFDVSEARGMLNARQAFIEDASFHWEARQLPSAEWQYALVFSSPASQTHVLLDLTRNLVGLLESDAVVSMEPMSTGLRRFIDEKIELRGRT